MTFRLGTAIQCPLEKETCCVQAGFHAFQITNAALSNNRQIKSTEKVGLAHAVLAPDEDPAMPIQAAELKRVFPVKWAEILERQ